MCECSKWKDDKGNSDDSMDRLHLLSHAPTAELMKTASLRSWHFALKNMRRLGPHRPVRPRFLICLPARKPHSPDATQVRTNHSLTGHAGSLARNCAMPNYLFPLAKESATSSHFVKRWDEYESKMRPKPMRFFTFCILDYESNPLIVSVSDAHTSPVELDARV
jgi:hypothetical protein